MEGSSQFSTKPTTKTVASTKPTARDTMAPLLSHSPRLLACRDSSNSNGAMNSTRNSSGSIATSTGAPTSKMMTAPSAICTNGNDTRGVTWSSTAETSTAANNSNTNSSISISILPSGIIATVLRFPHYSSKQDRPEESNAASTRMKHSVSHRNR